MIDMTVLEAIQLSAGYLEKKGIESARMNAELMLAHILKCSRLSLYLAFDKPLQNDEVDLYRQFLRRRGEFEPLQYITGDVEFYGFPFHVDSSVLIPRPETEILVETIENLYRDKPPQKVLDIGTGSGIIAISLARLLKESTFTAVDKSDAALKTASENAQLNGVSDSISFLQTDIFSDEALQGETFGLIVSNPPYIALEEYKQLQPEIAFEPAMALTDNSDGLGFYRRITQLSAERLLNRPGMLFFEIGMGQHLDVEKIMAGSGFKNISIVKDLQGIERVISGEVS